MKGLSKKVGIMSGLAALALVGSAFAVWHFGAVTVAPISQDYIVTKAVDEGTVGTFEVAGIPTSGAAAGKMLILDQVSGLNGGTAEAENGANGVHWYAGVKVHFIHTIANPDTNAAEFTYKVKFTLGSVLANYVKFTDAAAVEGKSIEYSYTEGAIRAVADFDNVTSGQLTALPTVDYVDPNAKKATTESGWGIADYNSMNSALAAGGTNSKITINLTVTSDNAHDSI